MDKQPTNSSQDRYIFLIGTLDTKGTEVAFLQSQIHHFGFSTRIMDVGVNTLPSCPANISREEIAGKAGADIPAMLRKTDGKIKVMEAMARGARLVLQEKIRGGEAIGVIALGGAMGTWIGMKVMRSLTFGFPKIMISTLPFDIRSHLGSSDIVIFPSVTDILGLNPILRKILQNAAGAMAGMVKLADLPGGSKPIIAITALGVTTPLVVACKNILEAKGYEIAAFHGVGIGGKTFEKWVSSGMFAGILDISTHDINNALFQGISIPAPDRLETAAKKNIPQIVVPGGLDFVTRGPITTLSQEELEKPHYRHSPMFTHVRVTEDMMGKVARTVADKLNRSNDLTAVAIPLLGFSEQDHPQGHLNDPAANITFTRTLKKHLKETVLVVEIVAHINDASFAETICSLLLQLIDKK